MNSEPGNPERLPDFERLAADNNERARRSRVEARKYLRIVLLLLLGTLGIWYFTRDIAKDDIVASKEAAQAPTRERVAPPASDFHDSAGCGRISFVVGDHGSVLSSTDDGISWQAPDSGSGIRSGLNAVAFSNDCKVAVAAGDQGIILVSTDGGSTWDTSETHTQNDFNGVALSEDGETAIAVGDRGLFRFSDDGGKTWGNPGNVTGKDVNDIVLSKDGRTAVAVGDANVIRISHDGGDNWIDSGINVWTDSGGDRRDDFKAVALGRDGKSAVVVGDNGAVLFSDDVTAKNENGDENVKWIKITGEKDRSDFKDVAFGGKGNIVVAVGRSGVIWASTDCCKTWGPRDSREGNSLEAVALSSDGKVVVAVGRDGTVLVSEDHGKSWSSRDSRTVHRLNAVAFGSDGKSLMIVGENRTVLRSEHTDGKIFPELQMVRVEDDPGEASGKTPGAGDRMPAESSPRLSSDQMIALFQNDFLRVGITVLFMFMAQHLFGLARYKLRLAAYYDARRDAILLTPSNAFPRPENISELDQLMQALSPDTLEIGRPSKTIMDRMMHMMDRFIPEGRRRCGDCASKAGKCTCKPGAGASG